MKYSQTYFKFFMVGLGIVFPTLPSSAMELPSDTLSINMSSHSTNMPLVWTYSDCVAWAIENNTDMQRTVLDILSAKQDYLLAKDAWLPNVGFTTNQSLTNYPSPERI